MTTAAPASRSAASYTPGSAAQIVVTRCPTEIPLFAFSLVVALVLWLMIVVSVVGLVYGVALGAFFFVMRLGFIAHLRGSAVRLGPDQLPELHERVTLLARRMGLERVPETFLMQAGGSLNAFATRFFGAQIVVLFSDLLDACGDDEAARDMIIAHELGHIHAGHLRWQWLLLPVNFVPFLGTALSRAREYTCDRYGVAGAGSTAGAVRGLTILAAGPKQAGRVNHAAFVSQREALNTGWMTIGEWLSTHPPLARRLVQVDPSLGATSSRTAGVARAVAILALIFLPMITLGWMSASRFSTFMEQLEAQGAAETAGLVDESDDFGTDDTPLTP